MYKSGQNLKSLKREKNHHYSQNDDFYGHKDGLHSHGEKLLGSQR